MSEIFEIINESMRSMGPAAYLLAALFAFGESIILLAYFMPGILIMTFIGFLCQAEIYSFWGMYLAAFLGHVAGENMNYLLGDRQGRPLFAYQRRFLRPGLLRKVERRFKKSALSALLVGHFIGTIRPIVSFTAGMVRYPYLRFAMLTFGLSFLWTLLYLGAGFVFGASWRQALAWLQGFGFVLLAALIGVTLCGWLGRRLIARFRI